MLLGFFRWRVAVHLILLLRALLFLFVTINCRCFVLPAIFVEFRLQAELGILEAVLESLAQLNFGQSLRDGLESWVPFYSGESGIVH